MEQSETSVEIPPSRSALEQTICPVFQEADRLRKESIAFWHTPSLTVQSLARKIMSEKPPISTKYIAGYTNMRDEIAELKKEDMHQQELDERLFALLKKQDPYMLESTFESLLFQEDSFKPTMENMPYFMYRYMKWGAKEYIASGVNPKLHGVLFQRLLTTGFFDIDEKTFTGKMNEMLEGTYLLFTLLRAKKNPYTKRNAYGVYMRHLSGAFRSAYSMIESARHMQNSINKPVQYSVPFDHWDMEYKTDGVLFSKESGKVIGLIQSKPAHVILTEKDREVKVKEVQVEYRHQSYQASGSTLTTDYWVFPARLFSSHETVKKEDVHGKKEYLYDISKFINGVQLLHFIEKDSFEDNWSPIFYTSHIHFSSTEKSFSFQKNSMNELIRCGKEFINQSLRLS